ncbi:hypothetical protein [Bacteroides sp. 51]|uniref:hypothetical protein n=1 Tax=Bacteroides sp. 51 TaxID=2302938 RepID=UPI0013D08B9B|nr:hypothetical protein [Bacteroides sp. 51]NDV84606.1 hypothetical protein [Bacteroides sp. 51]
MKKYIAILALLLTCQVDKLSKAIRNLDDSSYETMISSNEDGNRTRVLVKIEIHCNTITRKLYIARYSGNNKR